MRLTSILWILFRLHNILKQKDVNPQYSTFELTSSITRVYVISFAYRSWYVVCFAIRSELCADEKHIR